MRMMIIKVIVKLAEKTAMYSATKASGWYHYQPEEPKSLYHSEE